MKIAIATEGMDVSEHFGRCENFTLCNIENGKVTDMKVISTQGNQRGALPAFLHKMGVNTVISGGAGSGAIQKLSQMGIEAFVGVQGRIEDALNSYLKGELKCNQATCSENHEHGEHSCGCSCH